MYRNNDRTGSDVSDCDDSPEIKRPCDTTIETTREKNSNPWQEVVLENEINIEQVDMQYRVERGAESYVAPGHELPQVNGQASADDAQRDRKVLYALRKEKDLRSILQNTTQQLLDDLFEEPYDYTGLETFGIIQSDNNNEDEKYHIRRQAFFIGGFWRSRFFDSGSGYNQKRKYEPRGRYNQITSLAQLIAPNYSLEQLLSIELDPNTEPTLLADQIASALGETNPETIHQIVSLIGSPKACELFSKTKDIEKNGGIRTFDQSRRRSPGGVFIYLFRGDDSISSSIKQQVITTFQHRMDPNRRPNMDNKRPFSEQFDNAPYEKNEKEKNERMEVL